MNLIKPQELLSISQDKYGGTFQNDLDVSQEFVHDISSRLKSVGLFTRSEDDTTPFLDKYNKKIRLCDIMCINREKLKMLFFEAKDHCRCLYYNVTGQPQAYINTKLKLLNGGEDVFIMFRENMEWVRQTASKNNISESVVIDRLVGEGFAERKEDGSVYFIPYGHNLQFLLREENMRRDLEDKIKSHLSSYRGEKQYLWKIEVMLPIDKIISDILKIGEK